MGIEIAKGLALDAQSVMTGRCCVIGQSGSGKSYLVGVIAEELCRNQLPFIIIDTEGEYRSLRSMFSVLWVGGSDADVSLDTDHERLVRLSIERSIPVVFDLSEALDKGKYVESVLGELYAIEEKMRSPYLVIVEEADKFAPQAFHKGTNMIEEISVRGRKRGVGMVVATQRPATISKNVLAQCSYGFIGKLTIENDIGAVGILVGSRETLRGIPRLKTGEFIPFGLDFKGVVHVKERMAEPGGSTPQLRRTAIAGKELGRLISELRSSRDKARVPERGATKESAAVNVLKENFGSAYMEEFAERQLRKQFGVFGKPREDIDSIKESYMELMLCRIRIPTRGKREYEEHALLLDGGLNFVTVDKGISITKGDIGKPPKLSGLEMQALSMIAGKKRAARSDIAYSIGADPRAAGRVLSKLQRLGAIELSPDTAVLVDRRRFLTDNAPETSEKVVNRGELEGIGRKNAPEDAKRLISIMFPGAETIDVEEVFLPVYRITLRDRNRVRLFAVEAVFGRQVELPK